ncbi:hypothetical protein HYU40_02855 [Candidatus Woesearchaeota archaeon]|nr:hypothetical protein [Candidatus Woesearchaeota archaeon]
MPEISKKTLEDVASGIVWLGEGGYSADLAKFSAGLASIGFARTDTISVRAKRGSWYLFMRENPGAQTGEAIGSAVAVYRGEYSYKAGYLFMSRPGSHPDLEEIAHNAQVITYGFLEKSVSSNVELALRWGALGGAASVISLEVYIASSGGTNLQSRIMLDAFAAFFGGCWSGGLAGSIDITEKISRKDASHLLNPTGYIYGGEIVKLLNVEMAYAGLLQTGASNVSREAFLNALAQGRSEN